MLSVSEIIFSRHGHFQLVRLFLFLFNIQRVKNRFKLSEDRLEISKKGAMNTTMTFQRGEKSSSWYGTPVGDVQLGIEVTDMQLMEGEDEIEMNVAYALEMNSEHVSDSRIRLRIMERNKGLFRI